MRKYGIFLLLVWLGFSASITESGPGLMERIVESRFLFTQRVSPWIHTPKDGCDKSELQKSINWDFAKAGDKKSADDAKQAMKSANRYFGRWRLSWPGSTSAP